MNEEETKRLARAFAMLDVAEVALSKGVRELVKLGKNVPSMNSEATKMWLETIKSIDLSMGFIKSCIRVGVLQQVVKKNDSR